MDIDDVVPTGNGTFVMTDYMTPLSVFMINVASTFACFFMGKFAFQIMIQEFSFAFAVNLVVPVTLSGLIAMCGIYIKDECAFYDIMPGYLFFKSPTYYYLNDFIAHEHSWIWLIWLLSQTWITIHIWKPCGERVASTEKIFMRPTYDAFLIDQSVAMNRRRDEEQVINKKPEGVIGGKEVVIPYV